ncbi:diacylglycerol/polyprenol kinase family protein [Acholeplasma hippikon]|uniref:Cytidylyltransferase family n=1 Tax=Acholeplasma hippikon TaxID=264636 RepID=A0A449BII2_9MOLU|nr:hypothetical protein [Acholeplasma hippikon]VEU82265.1 Cytidylyltransferase family [Acholeplasma hippikon]
MNNILGLVFSFVFVFLMIGLSTILQKKNVLNDEGARKFIHIGVANWWFFVIFMFDNMYYAIIPPIVFILLNYASYKMNLIKSMERNDKGNLGTVYFPISLLLLVIASFTFMDPIIAGLGIFILGYGDGFAAVFGKAYGKKKLINGKSIIGTVTMFVASLIVVFTMSLIGVSIPFIYTLLFSIIIAVVATVVELFTPKGLDNLSIPLSTSLLLWLLLLLL